MIYIMYICVYTCVYAYRSNIIVTKPVILTHIRIYLTTIREKEAMDLRAGKKDFIERPRGREEKLNDIIIISIIKVTI